MHNEYPDTESRMYVNVAGICEQIVLVNIELHTNFSKYCCTINCRTLLALPFRKPLMKLILFIIESVPTRII